MSIPAMSESAMRAQLIVKATGLAGGIWHQTWLFEYDLDARRELAKVLVDRGVLPSECVMPKPQ